MSESSLQSSTLRRNRELILFCRQLGAMLNAGTDILRALLIVQDQVSLPSLRSALETARNDMTLGMTLAFSLNRFPQLFSPFFIDMIRQGEGEGTLGDVLGNLSDYLEKETRMEPFTASPALAMQPSAAQIGFTPLAAQTARWTGPVCRLAVWMGLGTTAAAGIWGIAAIAWSTSAGIVAAIAVLGLALAGWGATEQMENRSAAVSDAPAREADAAPAYERALLLPVESDETGAGGAPADARPETASGDGSAPPRREYSPPPPPGPISTSRASRRNMPL